MGCVRFAIIYNEIRNDAINQIMCYADDLKGYLGKSSTTSNSLLK